MKEKLKVSLAIVSCTSPEKLLNGLLTRIFYYYSFCRSALKPSDCLTASDNGWRNTAA
jgi:hypothetical protein